MSEVIAAPRADEAARLEALRRLAVLDSAPEPAFDRITHLAARLFRVPIALISLIDAERQWFKSRLGIVAPALPRATAFCDHAIGGSRVLVVPDAAQDPRFRDDPLVTGAPSIRFYAGAPLTTKEGHRVGAICVIDEVQRSDFTAADAADLEHLARMVMDEIELRLARRTVSRQTEALHLAERRLRLGDAIAAATADAASFAEALELVLRVIAADLGADCGLAWSLPADSWRLRFEAGYARPGSGLDRYVAYLREAPVDARNTIAGEAVREQKSIVLPDIGTLDDRRYPIVPIARDYGISSLISVPFANGGTKCGLTFLFTDPPPEIERAAALVRALSGKIGALLARKQAEEHIALLQSVVLHTNDAVMIVEGDLASPDRRIIYVNQSFTEMTGYSAAEIVGQSPRILGGPKTDRAAVRAAGERAKRGEATRFEVINYRKDGSEFWVESTWTPLRDASGEYSRLISIRRDTSESRALLRRLRENESSFRLLFAGNPIPMWVYERSTRAFLEVNDAAVAHYGYSREQFLGMTIAAIRPAEDAHRLEAKAAGRRSGEPEGGLWRHRKADASEIMVEILSHQLDFGGREAVLVAAIDVTEKLHDKAELLRAKNDAEAASRAKSEFLANISHELRTPLNAIMGFAEIMRDERLGPLGTPRYIEYCRDIHRSGTLLLSLIGDILDLAKIEAGKRELKETPLDIADNLARAYRLMRERAEAQKLRLRLEVAPGLPSLRADDRAVQQMLLNLLSNAIKFTPAGGSVTLAAALADDGLVLSVADTGIGVAAEDIEKVLEPFGQAETAYTRCHEGTGLGLPLVRSLIELHGGRLDFTSAPGRGTIVSLVFPPARLLAGTPPHPA